MTADFTTLSTPLPVGGGLYRADIPDGWQQGRGAFGGLVIALLVRAVEQELAARDPSTRRPVRSVHAALAGPVLVGPAEIVVEPLRIGSGVATFVARLSQGAEVQAHVTCLLGRERSVELSWREPVPPEVAGWDDLFPIPEDNPAAPAFLRHVELRVGPPYPFAAGTEARCAARFRLKAPGAGRDAAHLAALADVVWPSAFARLDGPRPMSTIAYTLQLHADPASVDPAARFLHVARAPVAGGGFCVEQRELWSEAGELLAHNHQTFAVIR